LNSILPPEASLPRPKGMGKPLSIIAYEFFGAMRLARWAVFSMAGEIEKKILF